MLFLLAWPEIDTLEDRDIDRELFDHKACMPQGEPTNRTNPMKMFSVQTPRHGCENVMLSPELVEAAPALLEHDPLDLILGERSKACETYLRHISLDQSYCALCSEEFWGGGKYAIDHGHYANLSLTSQGHVNIFSHPKEYM